MCTRTPIKLAVSAHLEMWVYTGFLLVLFHLLLFHLLHLLPTRLEHPPSPDWMRAELSEVCQHVLGHLTGGAVSSHEIGNLILFSQVARKDEWQRVDSSPDPNRVSAGEMQTPFLSYQATDIDGPLT